MENLTFTDGLLGGQPWLEEQENGPTFFPKPPLAPDEPEVIKNFDPERRPQLNFVLPALSHTDASAHPAPPPENSSIRASTIPRLSTLAGTTPTTASTIPRR